MLTTLRGCSYSVVLGRAVKTEFLALGTLVGTAALSYAAASGGSKEAPKTSLQEVKDAVKIDSSSKCVSASCLDFLAVLWSDWHVACTFVLRFCVCREEEDLYVLRLCCVACVCGSRLSEWIASRPSSQRQRRSQNTRVVVDVDCFTCVIAFILWSSTKIMSGMYHLLNLVFCGMFASRRETVEICRREF